VLNSGPLHTYVGKIVLPGMPYEMAEESMRFFCKAVLPELKKMDKGPFAEPREYSKPAE
jgi:hypothetical protein